MKYLCVFFWTSWKVFVGKRRDKSLSLRASSVLFSAGGVFVTRRGPGTTRYRPQQLRNRLTNIPSRPTTTAAASQTGKNRVYPDKACLLSCRRRWTRTTWCSRVSALQISRKWLRRMTRRHMTLTRPGWCGVHGFCFLLLSTQTNIIENKIKQTKTSCKVIKSKQIPFYLPK